MSLYSFFPLNNRNLFSNIFDETSNHNKNLGYTAVTKIIRIPNNNIVAKPLTQSSTNKYTAAAITVVKLESKNR